MKTEALKLADELAFHQGELSMWTRNESCRMIRRLVEELDCATDYIKQYQLEIKNHKYDPETGEPLIHGYPLFSGLPRGKPLSDEEIGDCVDDYFGLMALQHKYIYDIDQVQEYGLKLAREIEERHGIK